MNILSLNITNPKYTLSFGAKAKLPRINLQNPLTQDIVELRPKLPEVLPQKFTLNEFEEAFNQIMVKLQRLEMNIKTQRENLKAYYSAGDKYDYHELLKERQRTKGQLNRLAKKSGIDTDYVEYDIKAKKQYNQFAPKAYRAQSENELNILQHQINSDNYLFTRTKELLNRLIAERKALLNK